MPWPRLRRRRRRRPAAPWETPCGIHCGRGIRYRSRDLWGRGIRGELTEDPALHCGCCHGTVPDGRPGDRRTGRTRTAPP